MPMRPSANTACASGRSNLEGTRSGLRVTGHHVPPTTQAWSPDLCHCSDFRLVPFHDPFWAFRATLQSSTTLRSESTPFRDGRSCCHAMDMATLDDHPVHAALVRRLADVSAGLVLDLGAGAGSTVVALRSAYPAMQILAVDRSLSRLTHCRERTEGDGVAELVADLDSPLPMRGLIADVVVCHNVLECLRQPVDVLREIGRVLKPQGRLHLSHTDFAGLVINSSVPDLNNKVIETHALATPRWMPISDGYISRKLVGYAHEAGFIVVDAEAVSAVDTEYLPGGFASHRINSMVETIRASGSAGGATLGAREIRRWMNDLRDLAKAGAFFFSETAYLLGLSRRDTRPEPSKAR